MADNNDIETHKVHAKMSYKCTKCDHGVDWFSMSACSYCKGTGIISKIVEIEYRVIYMKEDANELR